MFRDVIPGVDTVLENAFRSEEAIDTVLTNLHRLDGGEPDAVNWALAHIATGPYESSWPASVIASDAYRARSGAADPILSGIAGSGFMEYRYNGLRAIRALTTPEQVEWVAGLACTAAWRAATLSSAYSAVKDLDDRYGIEGTPFEVDATAQVLSESARLLAGSQRKELEAFIGTLDPNAIRVEVPAPLPMKR